MENKYYTPDLGEFCLDFEGEINWSVAYEDKWEPFRIDLQDENWAYTHQLQDIVIACHDGYAAVRVPYITEEQILKEGWKRKVGVNNRIAFEKNNYFLVWDKDDYHVEMCLVDPTKASFMVWGGDSIKITLPCPTINHFRKIVNLATMYDICDICGGTAYHKMSCPKVK